MPHLHPAGSPLEYVACLLDQWNWHEGTFANFFINRPISETFHTSVVKPANACLRSNPP
jgi:hypothetical protein